MSESKHTPGPWFADGDDASGSFMITDSTGAVLCDRAPWESRAEQSAANARLIAASPELVDLVRALLSVVDCGKRGAPAVIDKANALLVKAGAA